MILPAWVRLALYNLIACIPVWTEFFTNKVDYSLRGLTIPILGSIMSMATVTLARTRADQPEVPNVH